VFNGLFLLNEKVQKEKRGWEKKIRKEEIFHSFLSHPKVLSLVSKRKRMQFRFPINFIDREMWEKM